jgi:hypothetical protein
MRGSQLQDRAAAHRVASHDRSVQGELSDQPGDVIGVLADGVLALWLVTLTMPAKVDRDHPMPRFEMVELRLKVRMVAGPPVDEDIGWAAVARLLIRQLDPVPDQVAM